jgi:hypothetical protein
MIPTPFAVRVTQKSSRNEIYPGNLGATGFMVIAPKNP